MLNCSQVQKGNLEGLGKTRDSCHWWLTCTRQERSGVGAECTKRGKSMRVMVDVQGIWSRWKKKSRLESRCGRLGKEVGREIRSLGWGARREVVSVISYLALGRKKSAVRTAENVYQCPLQLCLQLFQLSGDSVWILLAYFLEGNKVEEGTDSTRTVVTQGEQIVCRVVFKIQGILGKGTLCSVKLPLYWQNKVSSQPRTVFPTGIVPWRFLSASLAKAFFLAWT